MKDPLVAFAVTLAALAIIVAVLWSIGVPGAADASPLLILCTVGLSVAFTVRELFLPQNVLRE